MRESASHLQESLKRSFQRIKQDILDHESKIKQLSQEIKTLSDIIKAAPKKSHLQHSKQINGLRRQIQSLRESPKPKHQSLSPLLKRLDELTERQALLEAQLSKRQGVESHELLNRIDEKLALLQQPQQRHDIPSLVKEAVSQAVEKLKESHQKPVRETETPFASRMIKKLERNKKDIIKQRIIEMVTRSPVFLPELKEIIVDEKQYCSKASFYRYIEDLLQRGIIAFSQKGDANLVTLKGRAR